MMQCPCDRKFFIKLKEISMTKMELNEYDFAAEEAIINLLKSEGVAFRNEFRYRLERPSPYSEEVEFLLHHVIDRAISRMEENGEIKPTNLRGRRGMGAKHMPLLFYRLEGSDYSRALQDAIRKKRDCSHFITGLSSYAGFYAQKLWIDSIKKTDCTVHAEDVYKFDDKEAETSGDIDAIIEKDGYYFGIEIKNKFPYPDDINNKFLIAAELDTIPVIVARTISYGDRKKITNNGGLIKIYETAIFPKDICVNKMKESIEVLRYPIILTDKIDDHVMRDFIKIIEYGISNYDNRIKKVKKYLEENLGYF